LKTAIWLVILLRGSTFAAAPPLALHFHFETSESTTAVYHVACLAGNVRCSKANFETFWHTKQTWTTADQAELDAWSAILRKVSDAALPPTPAPYIGNSSGLWPSVAARHKVIRAALEARNLADFQGRTWQWIESQDSARLYRAIAHFRARLHPSGRKEVKALLPLIEKNLRKNGAPNLAAQMARFFETDLQTRDVYFHLIPGPLFDSDAASATPVSNHVFMEVTSGATPVAAASIMLHELTHYFYDNAPARKQAALMQQFAQSGAPEASSLYALLNEAIAVAVQAVLAETSRSTEDEYRDAFIPRLGRSTTPVLKESLSKPATLFQAGFVDAYIRAANRELGADARDPRFILKSAAFVPSDKGLAGYELLLKEFPPVSFSNGEEWQLFSNENLVFLTAYDQWGSLAESFPALTSYRTKRGFAYVDSGNAGRTICILTGTDSAAIVEVVTALTKLKFLPKTGLAVSFD
jgi:hypothetical protein